MKKLLAGAALAGLIFAFQPTEQVQADPNNASQTCKANNDFGVSHGSCVVFLKQGSLSRTAQCKVLGDVFGWPLQNGWKNQGQCIKNIVLP